MGTPADPRFALSLDLVIRRGRRVMTKAEITPEDRDYAQILDDLIAKAQVVLSSVLAACPSDTADEVMKAAWKILRRQWVIWQVTFGEQALVRAVSGLAFTRNSEQINIILECLVDRVASDVARRGEKLPITLYDLDRAIDNGKKRSQRRADSPRETGDDFLFCTQPEDRVCTIVPESDHLKYKQAVLEAVAHWPWGKEVVELLACGLRPGAIAKRVGWSTKTTYKRVKRVLRIAEQVKREFYS